jgi:hypothetical protein
MRWTRIVKIQTYATRCARSGASSRKERMAVQEAARRRYKGLWERHNGRATHVKKACFPDASETNGGPAASREGFVIYAAWSLPSATSSRGSCDAATACQRAWVGPAKQARLASLPRVTPHGTFIRYTNAGQAAEPAINISPAERTSFNLRVCYFFDDSPCHVLTTSRRAGLQRAMCRHRLARSPSGHKSPYLRLDTSQHLALVLRGRTRRALHRRFLLQIRQIRQIR